MQSGHSHDSQSEEAAGYTLYPTPMGAIEITEGIDYRGIITFFLMTENLGRPSGVYQSGSPVCL